jgi:hypothetical protein
MDSLTAEAIRKYHVELCQDAIELFTLKNADYATAPTDPLSNFELPTFLGVASTQEAIFIRFCDKVSRLANLLKRGPAVADESFRDTAVDAINYIILLSALKEADNGSD